MTQIEIYDARMMARLLSLLKPSNIDGESGQAKNCHFSLEEDNKLLFRVTDSEFAYISHFAASGDANVWKATIRTLFAKPLLSRLDRVNEREKKQERKRLVKMSVNGELIEFIRGNFYAALPIARLPNAFPSLDIPTDDAAWTTIPFTALSYPLRWLARSPGRDDPDDTKQECTLFADGAAAAAMEKVAIIAQGPKLPFDLVTTRHKANRVLAWLSIMSKAGERTGVEKVEQVEVAQVQEGAYYCLSVKSRAHILRFPGNSRKFPWAKFDEMRKGDVTICAIVDRAALANTTFLAKNMHGATHVTITFKKMARGWQLQMKYKESGSDSIANGLSTKLLMHPVTELNEVSFNVNTHHLLLTLQRAGGKSIVLTYRSVVSLLGVRRHFEHLLDDPELMQDEAFFRVSPASDLGEVEVDNKKDTEEKATGSELDQ